MMMTFLKFNFTFFLFFFYIRVFSLSFFFHNHSYIPSGLSFVSNILFSFPYHPTAYYCRLTLIKEEEYRIHSLYGYTYAYVNTYNRFLRTLSFPSYPPRIPLFIRFYLYYIPVSLGAFFGPICNAHSSFLPYEATPFHAYFVSFCILSSPSS
jgi:hypothetical protein